MTRRPWYATERGASLLALAVVAALVVAAGSAVVTGGVTVRWDAAGGPGARSGAPSGSPGADVSPTPTDPTPTDPTPTDPAPTRPPAQPRPPPSPVLAPASGSQASAKGLRAALRQRLNSKGLGPHVGVAVRDAATGKVLYSRGGSDGYVPASTTKILTTAAALASLGPDHRFTTSVVSGAKPGRIVLVGGGDPLLASRREKDSTRYPEPATIDELAARTAKGLRAQATTTVRLRVDDTLFSQPISPKWEQQYVPTGVAAPVSALWIDEAKVNWPSRYPRAQDPAMDAAEAFARALARHGVRVKGPPRHAAAPAHADRIAAVRSPTLGQIVEHVLLVSDNDAAEVLARQVALAQGQPATFRGATSAVRAVLRERGIDLAGTRLYDGSGLSRHDRLTPKAITQVLALAASPDHPKLRSVLTGLPTAGFSGSLADRFYTDAAAAGVGTVRAKTGTLTGVSSLAGIVLTDDGGVLTFAAMSDRVKTDPRPALDAIAAALAECGCSGRHRS